MDLLEPEQRENKLSLIKSTGKNLNEVFVDNLICAM